jgi:hypothetical protein
MTPPEKCPPEIESLLIRLEKTFFDPGSRQRPESLANLLADDFVEFGKSGRKYSKSAILDALATESPAEIIATEFQVTTLGPMAALITYRASAAGVDSRRSSVWILRDDRWQMLFHQGTVIPGTR